MDSSILSYWETASSELLSRLRENTTSKWPELNFDMFLSTTTEILRHHKGSACSPSPSPVASIACLVADHVEDLTDAVTGYCESPATLKALLKVYSKFARLAKGPGTVHVKESLMACFPKLFLCESQVMVGMFGRVAESAMTGEEEEEGDYNMQDSMKHSLYRTIARRVVLFLMQYATLLEDEST